MYKKKTHIHFIGIGGIGMSGIATILRYQGYEISGCDQDLDQQSIKNLRALGCMIYQGNNTHECQHISIDIIVYSSAIKSHDPEIMAAQKRGIPTIPRALMLAELMRTKYSVAIAGMHGKTTTTSLIAHILLEAQVDPTIIIGGHLKALSANARLGNGDFLVAEADESDRSFLHLHATIAIVTNIDLEHLETYRDLDDIKNTFKQFLNNLPFYGKAILCIDDPIVHSLLPMPHLKTILYGLDSNYADIYATDIILNPDHSIFTVWHKQNRNNPLGNVHLSMPGKHNILNALAAIALALDLAVPFATIAQALSSFKGIERRFSYRGTFLDAEIFDDYGHHPKEIEQTLLVARNRAKKNVMVVFQPHRYIRTHKLWDDFIKTFIKSDINHLIITDIYSAGESPIPEVTAQRLAHEIQSYNPPFSVEYTPYESDFSAIKQAIQNRVQKDDLVLLLGAGKINKLATVL